jgi:hypothetical protein
MNPRDDAWLKAQIARADPWAAMAPGEAERLGRWAMERVSRRRAPRWRQRAAIAAVMVGSSIAFAALVDRLRPAPPSAITPSARARPEVAAPAVEVAAPRVEVRAAAEPTPARAKRLVEPPTIPPAAEKPPAREAPESPLAAEARLVLTALKQLRIEGNPDAALATLDAYDARFPAGTLRADAQAARSEALARKAQR